MNEHKLTFFIYTMGCQMNVYESEMLNMYLLNYGLLKVQNIRNANIVIVNTCSVRKHAEQKAFSYLGRLIKYKNNKIIVIGCMAEHLQLQLKKRFKNIDLIIGRNDTNNMKRTVLTIMKFLYQYKPNYIKNVYIKSSIIRYLAIAKGCNNYCSYCIVPFVRGKEVSFHYQDIFNKCTFMVQSGAREIILLGQNVNSYSNHGVTFTQLLRKIATIEKLMRIRFMTNHPKDLNDDLIHAMSVIPKICPHIHLPIQSGSDKILYKMNRKYNYEQYINLINKLRIAIPSINITTDVIVGFPNETEEDFNKTLNAIRKIKFGKVYVFKYSQRPYTSASKIHDNISYLEKQRRHKIILEESNKISLALASQMIGSTQEVLIDKLNHNSIEATTYHGYKTFITINSTHNNIHIGQIINVKIINIKGTSLFGNTILNE
ncbi:MAG: tRNA (N6-isopentenyl adenosine(37)-C2)-methylthiotransferase MiaB [Endomicrobium sp.]|jgi:tRNA-2-methylthio-N6-dimethylallyladenosine synthase|nr:tRNA (N6-isopentenyl adenosine(37)-C2)-methylthiotransferase MiaB [Endomicrobium sp.]